MIEDLHCLIDDDTRDKVIVKQQLLIYELEDVIAIYNKRRKSVTRELYSYGGPMNGNKLAFTKKQLKMLGRISEYLNLIGE